MTFRFVFEVRTSWIECRFIFYKRGILLVNSLYFWHNQGYNSHNSYDYMWLLLNACTFTNKYNSQYWLVMSFVMKIAYHICVKIMLLLSFLQLGLVLNILLVTLLSMRIHTKMTIWKIVLCISASISKLLNINSKK